MRPLLFGLVVYLFTVVIHLLLWRTRRPTREYATLLMLCATILLAALGLSYVRTVLSAEPPVFGLTTSLEYGCFIILYGAIALSHISVYSAIQADSPSLSIVLAIEHAGTAGIAPEDLAACFSDTMLVVPRLNDLVAEGLVIREGPRFIADAKASAIARLYIRYRAILKLERGG